MLSSPTPVVFVGVGSTAPMDFISRHERPFHRATTGSHGQFPAFAAAVAQMSLADTTLALNMARLPVLNSRQREPLKCQVPIGGPSPATAPPKTQTSTGPSTLQPLT
jgi:hypothetical protein